MMIYFHWPFCESKCPYCDFNSHVAKSPPMERAWRRAFFACLSRWREELGAVGVETIFFGGGTPSTMPPGLAADLIDKTAALFQLSGNAEITLEANPSSTGTLADFRAAGINRLSLGVQSFDDEHLRFLGRRHDGSAARRALADAKRLFPKVSFDLIYALPAHRRPEAWRRELERALELADGHVSLYQLTLEKGTEFYRRPPQLPEEEVAAALYELTLETAAAMGFSAYEVSNFAAAAADRCRHNLGYWRYRDFLGVGPGARGRVGAPAGAMATVSARDPQKWLALALKGRETKRSNLGRRALATELLLMGLRLKEGINKAAFKRISGLEFEEFCDPTALDHLREAGMLELGKRIAVPQSHWLRLEAIIRRLMPRD